MATMSDQLQPLNEVLAQANSQLGRGVSAAARVTAVGFDPLDRYLGGGLRAGELSLLGGPQGLGKTTMALQMLRNVVAVGGVGVYFSFEHDAATVLERLIAIESGARDGVAGMALHQIREALENSEHDRASLAQRLAVVPGGEAVISAVESYGPRLFVHRSSGGLTDVDAVRRVIDQCRDLVGTPDLVVVDYLQKISALSPSATEDDRVTAVAAGLKDLALDLELSMLAVVAADRDGIIGGRRLRMHHLRGAAALAYEADVVMLINDKQDVVARHHLVFDVGNAEQFRDFAVLTIEKNRTGLDHIDLEFRKQFEFGRFATSGQRVTEQLVNEQIFVE